MTPPDPSSHGSLLDVDPSPFITTIASNGLLGVMLVVVGWFAWSKDRELQAERAARVEDAKGYTELALKLQAEVIDAVHKLADILEEMKQLMTPNRGGR
jgi:hypothetical protein